MLRELLHTAPGARLYPIPLVEKPGRSSSGSSRIRQRFCKKVALMSLANEYICALNAMYQGDCRELTKGCGDDARLKEMQPMHKRVHRLALREAARIRQARRGDCPTGARAVQELVKDATLTYTGVRQG